MIVEEGEVEAFEEPEGTVAVLGSAGAGSVVGELGFLDGRPRTDHVRAPHRLPRCASSRATSSCSC